MNNQHCSANQRLYQCLNYAQWLYDSADAILKVKITTSTNRFASLTQEQLSNILATTHLVTEIIGYH